MDCAGSVRSEHRNGDKGWRQDWRHVGAFVFRPILILWTSAV